MKFNLKYGNGNGERKNLSPFAFCLFSLKSLLAKKTLVAFWLLLVAFSSTKAQTWEAGGSLGASSYMGDLNQRGLVKPSGIAAGIFVQRNLTPYLSLKLNYNYGGIAGADSTSSTDQFRDRNLSFQTKLSELSLIAEFNFMKYTPGIDMDKFTPFLYLGVGIVGFNPQAQYQGRMYDLRPLMTEGKITQYRNNVIAVPYGAGVKYNFSGNWNIMVNAGYRWVATDYLDDVSGNYANKAQFVNPIALALSDRSGERSGNYIGSPGTQRGDYRSRDSYMFLGFTLSYTFVTSNCYY